MNVIYAEKPSLGRKIAEALAATERHDGFMKGPGKDGSGTVVTWGFGHMGGLVYPEVYDPAFRSWRSRPCPFIPEEYRIAPTPTTACASSSAWCTTCSPPRTT